MRCADVKHHMRGDGYGEPAYEASVGDLLWDPKAGEGHIIVAELRCGTEYTGRRIDCGCGGWGMWPCPSETPVCECGQDGSWRDHHDILLARIEPTRSER